MKIGAYETHPAADVFPMLGDDELGALAEDIKANGLRDPIVRMWVDEIGNGIRSPQILDGRNRLRACEVARVKPEFRDYEGDDPVGFVLSLNLHRRHLNESQRAMVAAKIANIEHGENRHTLDRQFCRSTQGEAAERLSVGERSVRDAKAVLRDAAPEVVAAVERGDLPVSAAAKVATKPAEEQRAIVDRLDAVKAEKGTVSAAAVLRQHDRDKATDRIVNEPAPLPSGPFRVIVADPPWAYDSREDDGSHRGALAYPSMTTDEVCALPIGDMAHDDCVLWLWTTNAFMRDAYRVLDAWGFQEKTILTWKKTQIGLGDWLRNQTEHCIVAVRGRPMVRGESQPTWFEAPRREHSRKPDAFFEIVERTCPAPVGGRFELFSREPRPGWSGWGAEAEKFSNGGAP